MTLGQGYSIGWKNRDHTPMTPYPRATITPRSYSWAAIGGPDVMEADAQGSEKDLWALFRYLRHGVELYSADGLAEWWGQLYGVEVECGGVIVSASLDSMRNSITVAYTYAAGGQGSQNTGEVTSASTDADSIALYGTWQMLVSASDKTAEEAAALAANLLAEKKLPRADFRHAGIGQGPARARLHFRGWWDTLAWKYYSKGAGITNYTGSNPTQQKLGQTGQPTQLEQAFQLTSTVTARLLHFYWHLSRVGAVADNIVCAIQADAAGSPDGVDLATVSITGNTLTTKNSWVDFDFVSAALDLSASTTYHAVLRRSGAADDELYYKISVDEALGYAGGDFQVYSGAWAARSPDADALFQVIEGWDSVAQLQSVVTDCGQFLAGSDPVLTASSLYTNPYQLGDKDGLQVINSILETGKSAGRRIVAWVTRERYVRIEEEATPPATLSAAPVVIQRGGQLRSLSGLNLSEPHQFIRQWAALEAAPDLSMLNTWIAFSGMQYVEHATKDLGSGRVTCDQTKGDNPFEIITEG